MTVPPRTPARHSDAEVEQLSSGDVPRNEHNNSVVSGSEGEADGMAADSFEESREAWWHSEADDEAERVEGAEPLA